jgi:hypothetical protein
MAPDEAFWVLGLVFFLGISLGKMARGMQPIGSGLAAALFVVSLVLYWLEYMLASRIVALGALAVYGIARYAHAKWQRDQDASKPK